MDQPTVSLPAATERPDRPLAYLGSAEAAYGEIEEIEFDPVRPGEELPNPHISITGETGSGKTQATKAILADLCGRRRARR